MPCDLRPRLPYNSAMLDLRHPPARPLLAASILSADFGNIAQDCRSVLDMGADLLHVDVMDGHFAPNLTMGVDMIAALRKHLPQAYMDVHLMVERPEDYVESFAQAGANNFAFHVEVCDTQRSGGVNGLELIDRIHQLGMHAGIVVNPPTPVEALEPYLEAADLVLIMSVNPGRSGQSFIPAMLDKARWVSEVVNRHTRVEMDGGLKPQNVAQAVNAGVDTLVTASALFGADDKQAVIDAFHACRLPD